MSKKQIILIEGTDLPLIHEDGITVFGNDEESCDIIAELRDNNNNDKYETVIVERDKVDHNEIAAWTEFSQQLNRKFDWFKKNCCC